MIKTCQSLETQVFAPSNEFVLHHAWFLQEKNYPEVHGINKGRPECRRCKRDAAHIETKALSPQ